MEGTLHIDGVNGQPTVASVRQAIAGAGFFWLDLSGGPPADPDALELLRDGFGFHPLAVEDAEHFGQRPKLDEYDGFLYMVAHGALADGSGTAELHIFFNEHYVVTVHHGPCPALDEVRRRIAHHHAAESTAPQIVLVYLIVDSLTDSFFPLLSQFDDQVDTLEDDILKQPTEEQLGTLFQMKRTLLQVRKVIAPQRDMIAALNSGVTEVPGMNDEGTRYFRDLYDHLIRISDLIDNYRDLLSGVMDTHLSTVSNRLNVVMKQLAIIATIFLPLSFLTGFFGQNYAWMVQRIQNFWMFLFLGVGTEVAAVVLLYILFKRRGWLGGPSA